MDDYAATVTSDTICFALFDFSYYVFNEMLALMIKRFTDDKTDNTYIKAVMLADGKAIDTHSLVTVTKKAT
jgi:HK97 family phage major capsid protein